MKLFCSTKKNIARSLKKAALFLLALLMLTPALTVGVAADTVQPSADNTSTSADHTTANVSAFSERFLCSEFVAHRGSAILMQDKMSVVLYFYGTGSYIDGKIADSISAEDTNALRFTVGSANRTFDMNVYYSYEGDGESFEEDVKTVRIERSDAEASYTVALPRTSEIKRIRLVPSSSSVVRFSLSSLFAVSTFADATKYEGELDKCELSADKKSITVHGLIPRKTVSAHSNAQIALYTLGTDKVFPEKNAEPIKTAPISASFEFRIPFEENSTLSSIKYMAAIITADGEILPISPPKYAEVKHIAKQSLSFKGIMGGGCTDVGEGTFIADADLSLLFDPRMSGYAYKFEGEYYYFSQTEADALKNALSTEKAKGCDILIRLLASNPEREVPFTYSYNESGVFYYALNASTEEGRKCIRAAISFINDKICSDVSGYIVGRNIDTAGEYNFVRAEQPLDKYSGCYMLALRTVYAQARLISPSARVFVGISNRQSGADGEKNYLYPNYDTLLLLEALQSRAISEGGARFSVLIEAEGEPASYESGTDIFGEKQVFDAIASLGEQLGGESGKAVLLWTPAKNAPASYSYLYYSALFSDVAECFCIDLTYTPTKESELINVVRGIDTVKTLIITAPHLNSVGVSAEAMPSYAPERLVLRELFTAELLTESPINALGRVAFRDYTKKSASPDIVRCARCEVLGYGLNYALCEFTEHSSCPAILDLGGTDELSIADTVMFDIMLEYEGEREIRISVCGKGRERSYSQTLTAGRYRLYTDTPIKSGEGEYIKISLAGEGKVYIYGISGESVSKFDAQLTSALSDLRGSDAPIDETARGGWTLFIIFVLAVSCMSAVLMRRSPAQIESAKAKNGKK